MRVAIIGGGFSGTAVAAALPASCQPLWFEKSGVFGAGLAYGTDDPNHLLNVPADKMSALADVPNHFAEWLIARGAISREHVSRFFAPRRLYRDYLQELAAGATRRIPEEVISLSEGTTVTTSGRYEVDRVVLATGYLPESGFGSSLTTAFNPEKWPEAGVREVVLIGSGLTAVDAALTVFNRYPGVRVTALSRRGRLPSRFEFVTPPSEIPSVDAPRKLFKQLREMAQASGWDAVFAAMRPHWEAAWRRASAQEQRQLLRHLYPLFDVQRHRMPIPSAEAIAEYERGGRFRVLTGRAISVDGNTVTYEGGVIQADLAIDCSGQSPFWTATRSPLARHLIATKQALPGPHGMGIQVSERFHVLTETGPSSWLYALGPMLRGQRWETTAVPEIRVQAKVVCEELRAATSAETRT